jgi:CHAD domain-containing protein
MSTSDGYDRVLAELNEERIAALTRISRRLQALIDELRATEDPTAQRRLRAEAKRYRWYLEVQREALGIRTHANLDEFYAIPEPR